MFSWFAVPVCSFFSVLPWNVTKAVTLFAILLISCISFPINHDTIQIFSNSGKKWWTRCLSSELHFWLWWLAGSGTPCARVDTSAQKRIERNSNKTRVSRTTGRTWSTGELSHTLILKYQLFWNTFWRVVPDLLDLQDSVGHKVCPDIRVRREIEERSGHLVYLDNRYVLSLLVLQYCPSIFGFKNRKKPQNTLAKVYQFPF